MYRYDGLMVQKATTDSDMTENMTFLFGNPLIFQNLNNSIYILILQLTLRFFQ